MITIAVDAMGGDYAPDEIIKGAIAAAQKNIANIMLVGDKKRINLYLEKENKTTRDLVEVVHTDEFIDMYEAPTQAIKKKKKASLVIAADLVVEGQAQGMVSAGNTGAVMEVALFNLGRIQGIKRPALVTFLPSLGKISMMLDSGANADCKPEYLLQFAQMGQIYAQEVIGIDNPRIGLLNIGSEPIKGNSLVLAAYELLSNSNLNFIGNIEIRDFLWGKAEVAVCDGFVGNMVLKSAEAAAELLENLLRAEVNHSLKNKLGALILKPAFRNLRKKLDHSEHGGALFLGLKHICIKSHGRAKSKTIFNAVRMAVKSIENKVIEAIQDSVCDFNHILK